MNKSSTKALGFFTILAGTALIFLGQDEEDGPLASLGVVLALIGAAVCAVGVSM